jgi:hypothetical protein
MEHNLKDILTFVIPTRIDSEERMRNLYAVLRWLMPLGCRILLLEADKKRHIRIESLNDKGNISYSFINDLNPCFHRTRYINQLLRAAKTKVVSVWDTDIIADYSNIYEAVQLIVEQNATLTYPYNGKYIMLTPDGTLDFLKKNSLEQWEEKNLASVFKRPFCGGAYFVDKEHYLEIGGENEFFTGWGPEDAERLRRTQIMGYKTAWTSKGSAFHLWHPRNQNSSYFDETTCIAVRKEFIKICNMDYQELHAYINTWNK